MTAAHEDGPAQLFVAPDKLAAHVVDWQNGGGIHGIGVPDDLALHHAPHEVMLLGLTGWEPSPAEGRAFGVALTWLSACHVGLAPTHAAVLARVSGAPTSGIVGTAALTAAREAEHVIDTHQPLLRWLDGGANTPFEGWADRDDRWCRRLSRVCALDVAGLAVARDATSAALAVFHRVGLRGRSQLVGAWTWSRLIGALSESLATQALNLRTYPLRLPHFDYEEGP